MKTKKCRECRSEMSSEVTTHMLDEGGVKVTLEGVTRYHCPNCGASSIAIPRLAELHRVIAEAIVHRPGRLRGAEIRYLRKSLGWAATDLADTMGVEAATVSRWENDHQAIGAQADRLLRMLVVHQSPIRDYELHDLARADADDNSPAPLRFGHGGRTWARVSA